MNYMRSFNMAGVEARQRPCLKGSGEPTTSTVGTVGELYMDESTGSIYKCIADTNGVYSWTDIINTNMEDLGAGDMLKSVYDINDNDVVDKSEDADKLGGQLPSYYANSNLSNIDNEVFKTKITESGFTGGTDANIKKNPYDETGDIIDTHLVIGTSNGISGNSLSVGMGSAAYSDSAAIGDNNNATGYCSFVAGWESMAAGEATAVIGGWYNEVEAYNSVCVGGNSNKITFDDSVIVGGCNNVVEGYNSVILGGCNNCALDNQVICGHHAKYGESASNSGTTGDAFIIGNGTQIYNSVDKTSETTRSNAFRVVYDGKAYGLQAFNSSGADYAEYFEWLDGNPNKEDRRGKFVTLDGEKIRLAAAEDDYILGVVSANPSVVGDVQSEVWQGMYLKDVFGSYLTQIVHHEAEYRKKEKTDPETGEKTIENVLVREAYDAKEFVLNPDYNPDKEYISREKRFEWDAIGMLGKLVVVDDGTCVAGGYCKPKQNGIATASEKGYRVLARLDETHVKILYR